MALVSHGHIFNDFNDIYDTCYLVKEAFKLKQAKAHTQPGEIQGKHEYCWKLNLLV